MKEAERRSLQIAKLMRYTGKIDQLSDSPSGVAKILSDFLRADPEKGGLMLMREVEWRREEKGFVPKMLSAMGRYLEEQQPVFDKMDYQVADIVTEHPDYTIKEITSAISEQYPKWKWDTLERRIRRLLKGY